MKITVINGSPRGTRGNTARLLDEVLAGLEAGVEVELIELGRKKILPCTGCDHCHKVGRCHLKDDYEAIKRSLLASDGFILASPNYIFSVTAQLKALFDRSGNLIHCLMLEDKYAAVVETSGGGEDELVTAYMTRFVNSTGAWCAGEVGSPIAGERIFPAQETLFARARALGAELCAGIRERRRYPAQEEYRRSFKIRMQHLLDYRREEWPAEVRYWQEHHAGGGN